jgi:hypothetical protein
MTASDLRSALERLGLNQCEFARSIGTTDRAVRHWMAGNRRVPLWVDRTIACMNEIAALRQRDYDNEVEHGR